VTSLAYNVSSGALTLGLTHSLTHLLIHRVPKKTVQNCFRLNVVKFPPTLIIFGTRIARRRGLSEMHLFSTSPNSCQRLTVLNADVPNCLSPTMNTKNRGLARLEERSLLHRPQNCNVIDTVPRRKYALNRQYRSRYILVERRQRWLHHGWTYVKTYLDVSADTNRT